MEQRGEKTVGVLEASLRYNGRMSSAMLRLGVRYLSMRHNRRDNALEQIKVIGMYCAYPQIELLNVVFSEPHFSEKTGRRDVK